LEALRESTALQRLRYQLVPWRRRGAGVVDDKTRKRPIVLRAREKTTARRGFRRSLDRLHPALANAPQPKRDIGVGEKQVAGVVIARVDVRGARAPDAQRLDSRMLERSLRRAGVERQLEFDFGGHVGS